MPGAAHLLIIDPQVDFCDPDGALYVAGAERDVRRIAALVSEAGKDLAGIHVTLDTHHALHVAHPVFWQDAEGRNPAPFTIITAAEVRSHKWRPAPAGSYDRMLAYVEALDANGRYQLCVWPQHCLLGSAGHAVAPELHAALMRWEAEHLTTVDFIEKGANPWTEHYSAIRADVPDAADPGTQLNRSLIDTLSDARIIGVAGEAGSHCVANTVRDLAAALGHDSARRLALISDCMSPVPGFEAYQTAFLQDMAAAGVRYCRAEEFAELAAQ